jgi:hypothetical protein
MMVMQRASMEKLSWRETLIQPLAAIATDFIKFLF